MPVGKALAFWSEHDERACADAIASGSLLNDPLDLRPLPLAGIPGWYAGNGSEAFHRSAACYQPKRAGRHYPSPFG